MYSYQELANSILFSNKNSQFQLVKKHPSLEVIGAGRSAYAFRIHSTNKVIKIFFPPFSRIAEEEANIYTKLQGSEYYPTFYESGTNYLVIDYIKGDTLFDCLRKGIHITPEIIEEIDKALTYAKEKQLNPSDIHLRNIILTTDGKIKLIDVARFAQTKDCTQWNDLKAAFHLYYNKPLFPKKYPVFVMDFIGILYKRNLISIHNK